MTEGAPIAVGVAGALGRMGRVITAGIDAHPALRVAALFDKPGSEGQAVDGRTLTDAGGALAASQVIIDFTVPAATVALTRQAAERGVAMIIGATGWSETEEIPIRDAAAKIAIVKTGNFSLGVNVLAGLVRAAAARLPAEDWDVEVIEAHHRRKVDAPSGTALMLGAAAATGRQTSLADKAVRGRDGITGARRVGTIGFAVTRGGGIVGEHSVVFAAEDEILTFHHSARDRALFARGALTAAAWVAGQPPGLYDMQDVLGFRE